MMTNEFYCVDINWADRCHYFRSKEAAMAYLWQAFLNIYADKYSSINLEKKRLELNEFYCIENFGEVQVCGFED